MQLPNAEEQIMKYLWKLEKAFMKDILNEFQSPKPATTTVATLLRRMIDKDVVGYTQYGKRRQYYPKIKKSEYFASHINGLIHNFFNDSASQFASFFTSETNLSEKELEELRDIVNKRIKNKK
ncbi:MAG: BlaI/MecI/CopY family transcriptional regulator [Bacteroidetes bacterium]|nr:BlaI/MecI/CopY family transcriptional regulator [Bacteroidota bacterium]MBL6943234.1 BlaI/MecI/CopY family transcriptional regulator [Bacteroidales bacterium]